MFAPKPGQPSTSFNSANSAYTSDKVFLSWRINNLVGLVDMCNAMGDKNAVVRLVKQQHYLIQTVWDGPYLRAYEALKDAVMRMHELTPGAMDDEVAYDVALKLFGEQMSCLGRANMLPQKDVETIMGDEDFLGNDIPPPPVPAPESEPVLSTEKPEPEGGR
jgi:hypothetical protein